MIEQNIKKFNSDEIATYLNFKFDLIPINQWNRSKGGHNRGKTPLHDDWLNKKYASDAYKDWIDNGYNLGMRIKSNQVVIDLDPRNYNGEDIEEIIAELLGFIDFDELCSCCAVVKTGGGGYHIYCTIPNHLTHEQLRETVDVLPGVEFKKKGRQVLCAGSIHPSGNYYTWLNKPVLDEFDNYIDCEILELTPDVINIIKREVVNKNDYSLGRGALTDVQLDSLILSKLDVHDYESNEKWFPILCASHHCTDGDGIDVFVDWCTSDKQYEKDEHLIRNRWESLHNKKDNLYTIGTLIKELDDKGEDSTNLKAVLNFAETTIDDDLNDETDNDNSDNTTNVELQQEKTLIKAADTIAADITKEVEKEFPDLLIHEVTKEDGKALKFVKHMSANPNDAEITKAIRLINSTHTIDSIKAKEQLRIKLSVTKSIINELVKKQVQESQSNIDLAKLIAVKTLNKVFKKSKHITCPPSGIIYIYNKTHWIEISDNFLSRLVQKVKVKLDEKLKLKVNELHLIRDAVQLCRIQVSTMHDLLHGGDMPKPVINCKNGELWLKKDGSHILKEHNYRSYLTTCLNVDYDPSAKAPLFLKTLEEIFSNFKDGKDIIRHLGELLGYTIQPYKNIASWWLFKGPGNDGKTTITKILGAILQNAQLAATSSILELGGTNSYNHAAATLVNKLAIVVGELPAKYKMNDAGMKLLSESGTMEANPKIQKPYPFTYSATVIMCSNTYPKTVDVSRGNYRRANIIPFNQDFEASGKADFNRVDKIINNPEEMSGVLNFMLEGYQRLRNRGYFKQPESCLIALDEWKGSSNNSYRFVKEVITKTNNPHDLVGTLSEIYIDHYSMWCQENEIEPKFRLGKIKFSEALDSLGFIIKKGGGNITNVYGGKLIKSSAEMDFSRFVEK